MWPKRGAGGAQLLQKPGIVSPLRRSRLLDQGVEQLEPLGSLSERGSSRIVAGDRESVDQPEEGVAVLRIIGHGDPEEPRGRRAIMPGQRQLAAQPRQGWIKCFPSGQHCLDALVLVAIEREHDTDGPRLRVVLRQRRDCFLRVVRKAHEPVILGKGQPRPPVFWIGLDESRQRFGGFSRLPFGVLEQTPVEHVVEREIGKALKRTEFGVEARRLRSWYP